MPKRCAKCGLFLMEEEFICSGCGERYGDEFGDKDKIEHQYYDAFKYYSDAACQGDAEGLKNLAYMYLYGLGTEQDIYKAFSLLKESANRGNSFAMTYLAHLYRHADLDLGNNQFTVDLNEKKALELYLEAAKLGNPVAQYNVGKMFCDGRVINIDLRTALNWLIKSMVQGNCAAEKAAYDLLINLEHSNNIDLKAEFEKNEHLFHEGNLDYIFLLGYICMNELVWSNFRLPHNDNRMYKNIMNGYECMYVTAEKGNPLAQAFIGEAYYYGKFDFPQETVRGIEWLIKSSRFGCEKAISSLAKIHQSDKALNQKYLILDELACYNDIYGLRIDWNRDISDFEFCKCSIPKYNKDGIIKLL